MALSPPPPPATSVAPHLPRPSSSALPPPPPPRPPAPPPPLPPRLAIARLVRALRSVQPGSPALPFGSSSAPFSLDPAQLALLCSALCQPSQALLPHSARSPLVLLLVDLCRSLQQPVAPSALLLQSSHRKRLRKRTLVAEKPHLTRRQAFQGNGSGPSAEGYPSCTAVSNAILSCFPTSNTTLVQHSWSKFIWNNNYPTFVGARNVDIYLFNALSEAPVANWSSIANNRGMIGIYVADEWFPPVTNWIPGRNLSLPYFFVITNAGAPLTGAEQHQATFTVLQTAPPPSYYSTASVHSASLAGPHNSLPSTVPSPNPSLQNASSGDSLPKWEIALIVIVGTLALAAFFVAAFLAFNHIRRKRQIQRWQQSGMAGSGASAGSRSPMMQNTEGAALMANHKLLGAPMTGRDFNSPSSSRPGSPLSATALAGAMVPFGVASKAHLVQGPSDSADGPITSVDASIMAEAFRNALRKPDFVPPPGAGALDSNGEDNGSGATQAPDDRKDLPEDSSSRSKRLRQSMHAQVVSVSDVEDEGMEDEEAREIIDRELASEGRSMTSVDNRRRPEVHS